MNLYEINNEILKCFDEETGEIFDVEKLEELHIERDKKIENIGLFIKNLRADAEALKSEIDTLKERKKRAENKIEQLSKYLDMCLHGVNFETPKVSISYRKSNAVLVDEDFIEWAKIHHDDLLNYAEPKPKLNAIKELINQGEEIPHAEIEKRINMSIK